MRTALPSRAIQRGFQTGNVNPGNYAMDRKDKRGTIDAVAEWRE